MGCHKGQEHSQVCASGVTALLCFCVTYAQPVGYHDHSRSVLAVGGQARSSFVSWLGVEDPIYHIIEMYRGSGSEADVSAWLLESTSASEGVEMAETGHEGHNHRRRLSQADDHSDHDHDAHAPAPPGVDAHAPATPAAEDDHADHDHAAEEEADSHAGHDHTGHDHAAEEHDDGDATSSTFLDSANLAAVSVAGEAERETVERALAYITACQIDASCTLGPAEAELENDRNSRTEFGLKVGLAMSFIAMTVIASYIPTLFMKLPVYHGVLACLNAFSGAVFLTVGLTHLLPHVAEYEASADIDTDYPLGFAMVAMGFLLVLFVEQVVFNVHDHKPNKHGDDEHRSQDIPLLERTKGVAFQYQEPLITQLAVGLHAVLECITMGLALSRKDLLLLYAAICAHKVFTAMSLSTRFLRLGCPLYLLTVLLLPFHLLPPLAVICAAAVGTDSALASLIMVSLATGTFLYVGAFEVVSEEFAEYEHETTKELGSVATSGKKSGSADDQIVMNDADFKYQEPAEWRPSKAVKFVMYTLGCGLLLAITAALPKHEH